MLIGELRRRVSLRSVTVTNVNGQPSETEALRALVWAKVDPATPASIEQLFGAQIQAVASHLITIRYRGDVALTDRIVWGSRVFHVRGKVDTGERHRWLVLACQEVVS